MKTRFIIVGIAFNDQLYFRNSIKEWADRHILVIKMFSEENALFVWNTKTTKLFRAGSEEGK
jgi:hypothetical protein